MSVSAARYARQRCGGNTTATYGIPLARVCAACRQEKVARYRTDIFTRYECDEVIDPEDVL